LSLAAVAAVIAAAGCSEDGEPGPDAGAVTAPYGPWGVLDRRTEGDRSIMELPGDLTLTRRAGEPGNITNASGANIFAGTPHGPNPVYPRSFTATFIHVSLTRDAGQTEATHVIIDPFDRLMAMGLTRDQAVDISNTMHSFERSFDDDGNRIMPALKDIVRGSTLYPVP